MVDSKESSDKYEILAGHQKIGSRYTLFPNVLTETNYAERLLPELIWIAVLSQELGEELTIRVIVAMAKCVKIRDEAPNDWFVFADHLASLPEGEINCIKQSLESSNLLHRTATALESFCFLYPMFPVQWLEIRPVEKPGYLTEFKELLGFLIDKRSRHSTIMLANAIYGLLVSGMLIVQEDSFVSDMNCLQEYPYSDLSKKVASSIRAMTNTLIIESNTSLTERGWAQQFWQRGLELEAPDFLTLLRGEIK